HGSAQTAEATAQTLQTPTGLQKHTIPVCSVSLGREPLTRTMLRTLLREKHPINQKTQHSWLLLYMQICFFKR
ncbi:MAG: hypothetical protein ACK53Y_11090, partial [bacterium]